MSLPSDRWVHMPSDQLFIYHRLSISYEVVSDALLDSLLNGYPGILCRCA